MKPLFAVLAFCAIAGGLRLQRNGDVEVSVVSKSNQPEPKKPDDDDDLQIGWLYNDDFAPPGKPSAREDKVPSEMWNKPDSDEDRRKDIQDRREDAKVTGGDKGAHVNSAVGNLIANTAFFHHPVGSTATNQTNSAEKSAKRSAATAPDARDWLLRAKNKASEFKNSVMKRFDFLEKF